MLDTSSHVVTGIDQQPRSSCERRSATALCFYDLLTRLRTCFPDGLKCSDIVSDASGLSVDACTAWRATCS